MSRTYRHKKYNKVYNWFTTKEEFDDAYEASLVDYSGWLKQRPKLPKGFRWNPDTADKVYDAWRVAYSIWDSMPIHKTYKKAVQYRHYGFGCVSYEDYLRTAKVMAKKDGSPGPNYYRHSKSWVCNLYFERPMRREVKRVLKTCRTLDTYDNTVYPEWTRGAAWVCW